jgi:NodT family efflux transporter outer membrane factor (OMF) lipoprotein
MRHAFVLCACALAGCAVGPNFHRPEAPKVDGYATRGDPTTTIEADGHAQTITRGADVVAGWWRLFGSDAASQTVARAIANNPNLEATRASLRRSKDLMRAGYGAFLPQVDAQLGGAYQQASALKFGQNTPASDFSLYTVGGTVSYAIDIWGGQRRQVESLAAQVDAAKYTLDGAYIVLCGNVISALVSRAMYRAQADATRAIVALEKDQLRVTEAQATGGTVPYANVLSIRSQIASTEALVPQLEQKSSEAEHLVAALVGEAPASWTPPDVKLADFTLPTNVPLSLPSKLVRQRPDILVAEAQLHSANAQIGVATAAMLPNITLSASGGANNTSLDNLFAANGLFGSVGAGLTTPLFHGGTLANQRRAAVDARDQALATYKQVVLAAFEQVADTLRALEHDAEQLEAEKEAVDSAEEASKLVEANYRSGIANYLQVIVANEQHAQAEIAYLQSVAQRFQDTIALYVALGGGWWNKS